MAYPSNAMRRLALVPLLLAVATAASGQYSQYDQYGPAVEVTIADLVSTPVAYSGRAVRTKGYLERGSSLDGRSYRLRDGIGNVLDLVPVPDLADSFETESTAALGRRIEVTGLFEENRSASSGIDMNRYAGVLSFWKFMVIPDPDEERLLKARKVDLAELAARPARFEGRTLRVVGLFRGENLFGDLPPKTQRKRSDWVLQEGDFAIWVTGKKPKGDGWQFDPAQKRDTGKWIEVTGKVEVKNDVAYVHAEKLVLTIAPPEPLVKAAATPPPPERPKVPPVVVFALPLDGDPEVPGDSRFVVQFSKDMDETTFTGRVQLRYLSAPRAGVRPLEAVSFAYEPGRRALTVDPGDRLGRGTDVELRLLPGIKDIDGLELVPRKGTSADGIVDALRYRIGT
jgi:hypothetical protein